MYSPLQLSAKYIRYYLSAANGKGHGIHSPFVFDFIINVLNERVEDAGWKKVQNLRRQLLQDKSLLDVEDYGAGSNSGTARSRTVGAIAASAGKSAKHAALLYRIARYYKPATMLELGSSLGLSSASLALGNPEGTLHTIEGAPAIARKAQENFAGLGLSNIQLVTGRFEEKLPAILQKGPSLSLAFVDGNHRKIPSLDYFEQLLPRMNRPSILIFDDIHWSREMEEAWTEIRSDKRVMLTVDLFFLGIVFFSDDFKVKQDFVIRF